MTGRSARFAVAALTTAVASPAHAHLVETGFGAFYDGIAHVAATPADLLVVVAFALFAGQRGVRAARRVMFGLPLAWIVGGAMGALWSEPAAWPALTTLTFGIAGALVALDARLRDDGVVVLAVAAGMLHGVVNGATMAASGSPALALAGAVGAIFFLTAILSAEVASLPGGWPGIAVRVVGSWIAASGLLMLGWVLRVAPS